MTNIDDLHDFADMMDDHAIRQALHQDAKRTLHAEAIRQAAARGIALALRERNTRKNEKDDRPSARV